MAADDVAKALMAMDDESVRARVAEGDLEGLGLPGLSPEERELVREAATDDPEISGYTYCNGFTGSAVSIQCNLLTGLGSWGLAQAASYARAGLADASLAERFDPWLAGKSAGGGW